MAAMGSEGTRHPNLPPLIEHGSNTPFTVSVCTFNAGNGLRGKTAIRNAVREMVEFCGRGRGPGIIGFQEIPIRQEQAGQATIDDVTDELALSNASWRVLPFENTSFKGTSFEGKFQKFSMAIAYDSHQLIQRGLPTEVILPEVISPPRWHRYRNLNREETPVIERRTQFVHFTPTDKMNSNVHIIVVNNHLSPIGGHEQREMEMRFINDNLTKFIAKQGNNVDTEKLAIFVIGDLNTAGRVGSRRSARQLAGIHEAIGEGFEKLNDPLEGTSSVFSSAYHYAKGVRPTFSWPEKLFYKTEFERRNALVQRAMQWMHNMGEQHRDHVFMELHHLEKDTSQARVIGKLGERPHSDHRIVATQATLRKTS